MCKTFILQLMKVTVLAENSLFGLFFSFLILKTSGTQVGAAPFSPIHPDFFYSCTSSFMYSCSRLQVSQQSPSPSHLGVTFFSNLSSYFVHGTIFTMHSDTLILFWITKTSVSIKSYQWSFLVIFHLETSDFFLWYEFPYFIPNFILLELH